MLITASHLVAQAQTTLRLVEPEIPDGITYLAPGVVDLKFEVSGDVKQVRILVKTDDDNSKMVIEVKPPTLQYSPSVTLLKGKNTIELLAFKEGQEKPSVRTSLVVVCSGKKCGAGESGGSAAGSGTSGGGSGVGAGSSGQAKGNVSILIPAGSKTKSETIDSVITVKKSDDIKVLNLVVNNNKERVAQPQSEFPIKFTEDLLILTPKIRLKAGTNTITVLNFENPTDQDTKTIICEGDKGDKPLAAAAQKESEGLISVEQPEGSPTVDAPSVGAYLKVTKTDANEIKNLQYEIFKDGQTVFSGPKVAVTYSGSDPAKVPVTVRIAEGQNIIRFFDADDSGNPKRQAFKTVTCKGENCAGDFLIAEFPSSSQNSRTVVGFEQAGASSASSETKPFLDFFFHTPFVFSRCRRPASMDKKGNLAAIEQEANDKYRTCVSERVQRIAAWGQIRFTTTPDQIAAVGVLPSNFVNQLGKSSNTVDLVQSFDFLVGLDFRLFAANGSFLSLIPGIRQRTIFSFAGGGGAINPLTARRELAQIFKIPGQDGPQRDDFISRYGTPPEGKEFVGLVPLDRDRFLRQWYMGLRLKTFYCDNGECTRFRNNFPAIVDVMFGQNEAVTGGNLFYTTVDPNDPTKTIKKRSFVLRFDAFYPFPLRAANFLYFYGSALMKVGAGGVRIQNPLFLDTAPGDVLITDSRVYIPPSDMQKMFQPSRDYYKLGVGINLTELFNRNKRPQ
jgi:hypothetical protein